MSAAIPIHRTRSTITTVCLDDITVDPVVQRKEGVDQRRVNLMAADFNPDALGMFILSQRPDGTLVCLDGMHRRAAAIQAGHKQYVDARVFTELSKAEEAALFLLYNNKKDPSAISRFAARVIAGDPIAVDMDRIIRDNGWRLGTDVVNPGVLGAINRAEQVYESGAGSLPKGAHPEVFDATLRIAAAAWNHDSTAVSAIGLGGLGQFLARFGTATDHARLIRVLADITPRTLQAKARAMKDAQGGTTQAALAKVIVGVYNARLRTNLLPEWVWTR